MSLVLISDTISTLLVLVAFCLSGTEGGLLLQQSKGCPKNKNKGLMECRRFEKNKNRKRDSSDGVSALRKKECGSPLVRKKIRGPVGRL